MLIEENDRSRSLKAQKTHGTLSLDQLVTKEAVSGVLKMRVVGLPVCFKHLLFYILGLFSYVCL